ncbi:Hypothetical predicted protein, partial [Scomber scombrus]
MDGMPASCSVNLTTTILLFTSFPLYNATTGCQRYMRTTTVAAQSLLSAMTAESPWIQ